MKNQYFGDVNDYRKYGLLRGLLSGNDLTLLVGWMLTPDDGGPDGKLRSYLTRPRRWRRHDPLLFDGIGESLRICSSPTVSLIETGRLLPRTRYHSRIVPDAVAEREAWRRDLLDAGRDVDLVFFDPDNGIEIRSRPVGRKGSSKYVTWGEIIAAWKGDSSVLVYQHFRHECHAAFAQRMLTELRERTGAPTVLAVRAARVLFLLAPQARHEKLLREAARRTLERWEGQLDLVEPEPSSR